MSIAKVASAPGEIEKLEILNANIDAEKISIDIIIKDQNLNETIKQIEIFQKQSDEVETRLTEIQNEINQIKDNVLKLQVVVASATQTYLKHKVLKCLIL